MLALIAGLLILGLALWVRSRTPPNLENPRSTMGRIVKIAPGILKRNYTVEFESGERVYAFQFRGYYRQYAVGRFVPVAYDGDAPSNACLNSFFITRGRFYLAGGCGILLMLIALVRWFREGMRRSDPS